MDADGIHFGGAKKMTLTDTNGQLGMRNDEPSWGDRAMKTVDAIEAASSRTYQSMMKSVKTNALGDALNRSGTSDSELNRRWNSQIQHAEASAGL